MPETLGRFVAIVNSEIHKISYDATDHDDDVVMNVVSMIDDR